MPQDKRKNNDSKGCNRYYDVFYMHQNVSLYSYQKREEVNPYMRDIRLR